MMSDLHWPGIFAAVLPHHLPWPAPQLPALTNMVAMLDAAGLGLDPGAPHGPMAQATALAAAAGEWIATVLYTALLAQLGRVQDRIRYRTAGTNTWRHTFAGLVAEGQSLRDAQTLVAAWVFLALVAQRWGELRQVILQLHSAGW